MDFVVLSEGPRDARMACDQRVEDADDVTLQSSSDGMWQRDRRIWHGGNLPDVTGRSSGAAHSDMHMSADEESSRSTCEASPSPRIPAKQSCLALKFRPGSAIKKGQR